MGRAVAARDPARPGARSAWSPRSSPSSSLRRRRRDRRRRGRGRRRRPGAVPAGHHPAAARSPACSPSPSARWTPAGTFAPAGVGDARAREHERLLTATGVTQTEVFPLLMFAVGGMLLFPAANDLLTMFVALEVLSLPLYLLCGLARRRRLLSQEASLKYFLLGAFSSAFFLYGVALLYGYAGTVDLGGIAEAVSTNAGDETLLLIGTGAGRRRPAVQGRRRAVPRLDPGRLPGRADPDHRLHGRLHQGRRVRRAAAGVLRRRSAGSPGTGSRSSGRVAILTMVVGSVVALTQTDVKRMLAYSSIAHAGFLLTGVVATDASTRTARARRLERAVLPARLRLHDDRRVRGRDAGPRRGRRGDAPVAVGRAGAGARRWSPASSRSSCSPSPASRSPAASPASSRSSRAAVDGRRAGRWSSSAS